MKKKVYLRRAHAEAQRRGGRRGKRITNREKNKKRGDKRMKMKSEEALVS